MIGRLRPDELLCPEADLTPVGCGGYTQRASSRRPFPFPAWIAGCGLSERGRQFGACHSRRVLYCKGGLKPLAYNKEENMKNPLDSLWGTVISGLVLTLILYWIVKLALGS